MTNGDKIRQMSDEELAGFIFEVADDCGNTAANHDCGYCKRKYGCEYNKNKQWLESEAEK